MHPPRILSSPEGAEIVSGTVGPDSHCRLDEPVVTGRDTPVVTVDVASVVIEEPCPVVILCNVK